MRSSMTYKPEWVREDFVDFIAEKINPIWAWKRIKASVVAITALSADFFKIQLKPNLHFKAVQFQAGQSILLTVVVAGVRQQRSYSVLELTQNGDVMIAVRVQGLVSKHLAALQIGDVLEISQPQGEFVLQQQTASMLLIASGSGITAIYALLKQALTQPDADIALLYFSRDAAFHVELEQLAQQHPTFNYQHIDTRTQRQHLTQAVLEQSVADFKERQSYACGAPAMMHSLNQMYQHLDITQQLKQEYFQLVVDETLHSQSVTFLTAQKEFQANTNLLTSAEQSGLKPAHGCRMGICNTCSCTKISGSTKNLLTGEIDHAAHVQIKLCISQAVSPVVINL